MRIALLNQFFPPDIAPTGRLAADLARHRAEQGDEVTVVTGRGSYVGERITDPAVSAGNPCVRRLWTPGLGKGSLLRRLVDYAWFYMAAAVRLLALPRQDLVIALTTPPFIAWAGVLHKWLHPRTRLVLWNMDSYPEAPIRAGLIREGGWAARLLRWLNRQLFRQLDQLVCLDSAMQQLLMATYAPTDRPLRSCVIANWESAARFDTPRPAPESGLAEILGTDIPPYAAHVGNAGYGHDFETAAAVARATQGDPMGFVFIGGGARWAWLETAKRGMALQHWYLVPYLPEDRLMAAVAGARCVLITLRDSFLGVISPSKLHAALALAVPILYIGPQGSNVDECIQRFGCGASVRHGDVQGAVDFLRRLVRDEGYFAQLRRRARKAFESAYSDRQALPAFDALLAELRG